MARDRAKDIVDGDRMQKYGHPYDSFTKHARIWSVILGVEVVPEDVAHCMIAFKLVRDSYHPSQENRDDIEGYTYCLEKIEERRRQNRGGSATNLNDDDIDITDHGDGDDSFYFVSDDGCVNEDEDEVIEFADEWIMDEIYRLGGIEGIEEKPLSFAEPVSLEGEDAGLTPEAALFLGESIGKLALDLINAPSVGKYSVEAGMIRRLYQDSPTIHVLLEVDPNPADKPVILNLQGGGKCQL